MLSFVSLRLTSWSNYRTCLTNENQINYYDDIEDIFSFSIMVTNTKRNDDVLLSFYQELFLINMRHLYTFMKENKKALVNCFDC